MRLASFDIFDTTLIRLCGEPISIFQQIAQRLYPNNMSLREAFLLWRIQAGSLASKANKGKDVSLDEIYEEIDTESFCSFTKEEMISVEKDVEANNLKANPLIRSIIQKKRAEGYKISFISDMYLDSEFLKKILIREKCAEEDDYIFVSCEHNVRKDTGLLFSKVKKELHPTIWEHYGDNRRSDFKIAKKTGIKATLVDTSFNPAEKELIKTGSYFRSDSGWKQLIALSRAVRIKAGNTPYAALAADFVAPAYIPYVLFILNDAHKRGIRRLYFLSRDSYILLLIAQVFAKDFPDIELKYLFISRRALYVPYLHEVGAEEYLEAADHHTIIHRDNIDKLLLHLSTSREELQKNFNISFDYHRVENNNQEQDFLNKIFNSPFTPLLQKRAFEQKKIIMDYFDQEKLFDGTLSAMVDVGWLGTTRLMINSILQKEGHNHINFYYYGARRDTFPPSVGNYISYFGYGDLPYEITILAEHYFSASPYPTTIGYRKNQKGEIVPRFPDNQKYNEDLLSTTNSSISIEIANNIRKFKLSNNPFLYTWAKQSIHIITKSKTPIDLSPLAKCTDFDKHSFVKKLSIVELFNMTLLGKNITLFDWASLKITVPRFLWKPIWKAHSYSSLFRRKIYLKTNSKIN